MSHIPASQLPLFSIPLARILFGFLLYSRSVFRIIQSPPLAFFFDAPPPFHHIPVPPSSLDARVFLLFFSHARSFDFPFTPQPVFSAAIPPHRHPSAVWSCASQHLVIAFRYWTSETDIYFLCPFRFFFFCIRRRDVEYCLCRYRAKRPSLCGEDVICFHNIRRCRHPGFGWPRPATRLPVIRSHACHDSPTFRCRADPGTLFCTAM